MRNQPPGQLLPANKQAGAPEKRKTFWEARLETASILPPDAALLAALTEYESDGGVKADMQSVCAVLMLPLAQS